jgi:hypothetical protein
MFRVVKLTGLWQHADFMKLWLGQTVSLLGDAVTDLALPLTAVLTLQATPVQMGNRLPVYPSDLWSYTS